MRALVPYDLIGIEHLLKKGTFANWKGSSKGMEGEGARRIGEILQKQGIVISSLIHDGDAETINAIRETNNQSVKDLQDIGHKKNA